MNIVLSPLALRQLTSWVTEDKKSALKVLVLLEDIRRDPFKGIGKPEALKANLKGYWSRRINQEHRLVYRISGKDGENKQCLVIQCRFHY